MVIYVIKIVTSIILNSIVKLYKKQDYISIKITVYIKTIDKINYQTYYICNKLHKEN